MCSQKLQTQENIIAAQLFEEWFGELQRMFPHIHPATDKTPLLVSNRENTNLPIHRWYNLKESYAASLPLWVKDWISERYNHRVETVCDPFLGSGTTGVALGTASNISVFGIEYNPFIRFVAATKAQVSTIEVHCLTKEIEKLAQVQPSRQKFPLPALSTLHNTDYSPPENIQFLLGEIYRIQKLDVSPSIKKVLLLGVAAIIDDAFHLHKDGRALRYRVKSMGMPLKQKLLSRWNNMLIDIQEYQQQYGKTDKPLYTVYEGSSTDLHQLCTIDGLDVSIPNECIDSSIFSPPYLNNFDYSEIYKLELWLLDFINSKDMWRNLRLGTIRSHSSIKFPITNYLRNDPRTHHISIMLEEMANSQCISDKNRQSFSRELYGYFDDMYLVLCEQWRILKKGGILAYNVANSRHNYLPVATDVIIAEIARALGFKPLDLVILRKRNGRTRQKLYLRESIAFFIKPT